LDQKNWSVFEARAKIIKALAHPVRLFIIEELKNGERCVNELQEMIGYDMSTISKHLSILKNAGIVDDKKSGTSSFYYLRVPCIINFFGCVEEVLESNLKQQNEIVMCCRKK
jgi:DNA-binding transcriptional ArsR family regulator